MPEKKVIDARGMACPGPIALVTRYYRTAKNGDIFEILATDHGFIADIKTWAENTNNKIVELKEENGVIRAVVEITGKK